MGRSPCSLKQICWVPKYGQRLQRENSKDWGKEQWDFVCLGIWQVKSHVVTYRCLGFFSLVAVGEMVSFAGWCWVLWGQGLLWVPPQHLPSAALKALLLKHSLFQLLIEQLRDRLFHAQGENVADQQPPPFPYTRVSVGVIKHVSPAAKGGSAPEGAAHKTSPRHPEKVGLKLRGLWLEEGKGGLLGYGRHVK